MKKIIVAEIVLTPAAIEELTDGDVLLVEQKLNERFQLVVLENDKAVGIRFHFKKEIDHSEDTV